MLLNRNRQSGVFNSHGHLKYPTKCTEYRNLMEEQKKSSREKDKHPGRCYAGNSVDYYFYLILRFSGHTLGKKMYVFCKLVIN